MDSVILIADSFTSANFNVMLDVIRAKYNNKVLIHAVSANNDPKDMVTWYSDVKYYPICNYKIRWNKNYKDKPSLGLKVLNSLVYRITSITDNFVPSPYELRMQSICKKIIKGYSIDTIFSVCQQFYTHRIAYNITRKTTITWFPFWVDGYVIKNRTKSSFQYRCMKYAEEKNLKHAPRVYCFKETFAENEFVGKYSYKMEYFNIPYLVDREVECSNKDVVFAGVFYKDIRNPEPLFNLILKTIPLLPIDIVFKFYVNAPEDYRNITDKSHGRMQFFGFVNRNELSKILSSAYMLLNLGNDKTSQMPSKVIEYISYRKPILFFYSNMNDNSFEYFNVYPDVLPIYIKGDEGHNIGLLSAYIQQNHHDISYNQISENSVLRKNTPEYLRQQLNQ